MALEKCETCGEYIWSWRWHRCPPAWLCWLSGEEYGMEQDEASRVYASSAGDAAASYVEGQETQWAEYGCLDGDEKEVSVLPADKPGEVEVYAVTGEMVPEYRAEKKTL